MPLPKPLGCQGYKKIPFQEEIKLGDKHYSVDFFNLLLLGLDSFPQWLSIQAVQLGELLLVTVPGEATAESGGDIKAGIASVVKAGQFQIDRWALVGLANQFASYFTTKHEYDTQHYEGGSTIYGPSSSEHLCARVKELVSTVLSVGSRDYTKGRRVVGPPAKNEHLWPKPDDHYTRRSVIRQPRHEREGGEDVVAFDWKDAKPGSIDLHLPLVKIEVEVRGEVTPEGDARGRDLVWGDRLHDDRGLDMEIRWEGGNHWRARWYLGKLPELPRGDRYRFVVLPRETTSVADALPSDWFKLPSAKV